MQFVPLGLNQTFPISVALYLGYAGFIHFAVSYNRRRFAHYENSSKLTLLNI